MDDEMNGENSEDEITRQIRMERMKQMRYDREMEDEAD